MNSVLERLLEGLFGQLKFQGRFGLVNQSLLGFAVGALFVAALIVAGDSMLNSSSKRLEQTLNEHIRPLAGMHNLQSRIDNLRTAELELARQRDVFQVSVQVAGMFADLQLIDTAMAEFVARLGRDSPEEAERLRGHWSDYRVRIEDEMRQAELMKMGEVERIANGSFLSFAAIQSLLGEVVNKTEASAESGYQAAIDETSRQRRVFMVLVLLGSLALVTGLAISARVVVRRVSLLNAGAQQLAAGNTSARVEVGGHDEISDLGDAFNTMRQEVVAREDALRAAHEKLEQRVAERTQALSSSNAQLVLFSEVVEQNPVGILVADDKGEIAYMNPAYLRITGFSPEELSGKTLATLFEDAESTAAAQAVRAALHGRPAWHGEQIGRRADGSEYWERLRIVAVHDDHGRPAHVLLTREDITERREQEEKIAYQAHYDALTNLPNRVLALDRLAHITGQARRDGGKAVVLFIDLDNFKQINDTLGHDAGDELLRQAATRLRTVVRDADSVARLGGDEFLVLLSGMVRSKDAAGVAEKIIQAFAPPFLVGGRELSASPSIGLAVFPDDGEDPPVLLRNADLAMYEAKDAGRNTYRFFNQSIHDISLQRLEISSYLRTALERGELKVHYQPLIAAKTGQVVGAEALLRWQSPELGTVLPEVFIPVAEQSGLIVSIGSWVMQEATMRLSRWREKRPELVIAVNVSPRQFRDKGFAEQVKECLKAAKLPAANLEVEVTEGLLMRNPDDVREVLEVLRVLGVRVSMDDFGTGYSSLSYLREFPFNTLKIDKAFVGDLTTDAGDRDLVTAAVRMAKALGLRVIAEGVETDAQWAFLTEIECDVVQGFRFGRPVIAADFEAAWLSGTPERISLSA